MFGEGARNLSMTLVADYRGFLLAILPPGAFIGLGLIIALYNVIKERRQREPVPASQAVTKTA